MTLNADGSGNDVLIQSNGSTKAIVTGEGNVGVGVTPETWASTQTALQVGGVGSLIGDTAQSAGQGVYLANNAYYNSGWKHIVTDEASSHEMWDGKHLFKVAASGSADAAITWTTPMTILNNGYIDFGAYQNTPSSSHGIEIRSGDGQLFIARNGTGSQNMVFFKNSNGTVGTIDTSGSATSYNTSSDYRLKENVDYTWDATTRLKQLKPARFNFIADDTTTVDGFLAHEAATVVPECVSGTKDAMMDEEYEVTPAVMDGETVVTEAVMGTRSVPDMQGIDQSKLVPLLVKTIQELEARITALEG